MRVDHIRTYWHRCCRLLNLYADWATLWEVI